VTAIGDGASTLRFERTGAICAFETEMERFTAVPVSAADEGGGTRGRPARGRRPVDDEVARRSNFKTQRMSHNEFSVYHA
jgi:hypothetical protein